MRARFSKRNQIMIGVSTLLLVLLIVYGQFFYLSPLKKDLQTKQQTLKTEQKLLDIAAQKQQKDTAGKTIEDTRELQKKIPVKPMQDELILDLEKAETVSGSQIKSMSFSQGADVTTGNTQANGQQSTSQSGNNQAASSQTQAAQNSTNQNNTNQNSSNQTAATNQNQATQQAKTPSITGLKKLTVGLSVESPNFDKFETFIQTLESLQRIVVVESITYSGGQEITSLTQTTQPLSYSLTVSAFYMPALTDLASQLPKMDAPAPAGKVNPLPQFSNLTP